LIQINIKRPLPAEYVLPGWAIGYNAPKSVLECSRTLKAIDSFPTQNVEVNKYVYRVLIVDDEDPGSSEESQRKAE